MWAEAVGGADVTCGSLCQRFIQGYKPGLEVHAHTCTAYTGTAYTGTAQGMAYPAVLAQWATGSQPNSPNEHMHAAQPLDWRFPATRVIHFTDNACVRLTPLAHTTRPHNPLPPPLPHLLRS